MGVSEIFGVPYYWGLIIRESYYLGKHVKGSPVFANPQFRKRPIFWGGGGFPKISGSFESLDLEVGVYSGILVSFGGQHGCLGTFPSHLKLQGFAVAVTSLGASALTLHGDPTAGVLKP